MTSTGVVVIAYNSAEVIGECLDACLRIGNARIIAVDNASQDDTVRVINDRRGIQVIRNDVNRGFAAAANQGIGALETDTVLILNPDAALEGGIGPLVEAASTPGVGAAGGRLRDAEGGTQHGFNVRGFPDAVTLSFEVLGINYLWPGNPVNQRYRCPVPDDRVTEVDQPAGAFLMVNRAAWEAVGGFDEDFYPIWFEDVDFCKRLHEAGYHLLYEPACVARHVGGHSAGKLTWRSRQLFWYGSLLRYSSKHFSLWPRCLVSLAVILGSIGRMIHSIIYRRSLEPVSVYSKVIWLACSCGYRGALARSNVSPRV